MGQGSPSADNLPGSARTPVTRAVIDIGTNSVKLLVADTRRQSITPRLEKSEQTRLGSGFYGTHRLLPGPMEHTAQVVAQFAAEAQELGTASLRVIATSAARDAINQADLVRAVHQASGRTLEIISGEQEAEWAFQGVAMHPELQGRRLLILDVGGGSSEFVLGERNHHTFRKSFSLGSVRLLENLRPDDPPSMKDLTGCREWLRDFFVREVIPSLQLPAEDPIHPRPLLVGSGGTSTILARIERGLRDFARQQIEGTHLAREQLLKLMVHLWSLSLADRKKIVGLPPSRADVILMGVAIYEAVMEHLDFDCLRVTTQGLRFGALLGGGD